MISTYCSLAWRKLFSLAQCICPWENKKDPISEEHHAARSILKLINLIHWNLFYFQNVFIVYLKDLFLNSNKFKLYNMNVKAGTAARMLEHLTQNTNI